MEKFGFVYIWYDRKHKRFYVGSHWGTTEDGYICSSNWMKQAYKHRGERDFKRRILSKHETRELMFNEEQRLLSTLKKSELGTRYYNLATHTFNHWSANPERKKTFSERQSEAQKKRHLTIGTTEETRKKLSKAGKGKKKSAEHVAKVAAANKGKNINEAFKQMRKEKMAGKTWATYTPERASKISASLTGRPLSEEHKASLRAGHALRRERLNKEKVIGI